MRQVVTARRDSDRDVLERFWRTQVHLGLLLWTLIAAGLGGYLLATPHGPHRLPVGLLAAGTLAASFVVFWGVGLRMIATRWRVPFFFAWSLFIIAMLAMGAWLDGGVASPIVSLLALPVLFAGLAYPPAAVLTLAAAAGGLFTLVAVTSDAPAAPDTLVGIGIGIACVLATTGAYNRDAQQRRLYELATHDGLTGCLTRRAFQDRLETEVLRAGRYGRPLSLVMGDLDRLKELNDTRGHAAGDHALAGVGTALLEGARDVDLVGRIGGDEFAVLLPETGADTVPAVVERFRTGLRTHQPAGVSVSFGWATLAGPADTAADLLRRADQELYAAKPVRAS